jgi:hypothetical protein
VVGSKEAKFVVELSFKTRHVDHMGSDTSPTDRRSRTTTDGNETTTAVSTRGAFGWLAMTKTGPNDTSGVVWALGIFRVW